MMISAGIRGGKGKKKGGKGGRKNQPLIGSRFCANIAQYVPCGRKKGRKGGGRKKEQHTR